MPLQGVQKMEEDLAGNSLGGHQGGAKWPWGQGQTLIIPEAGTR